MPYRSARPEPPKLTPEVGIVDDMVRQFADRHAFLRELVQNGIDAGATRIDVRVERSPDGAVRTSVEDDGSGMTRAIIEGPLLTLFQSSKEDDSSKIGKYGIGFVSVFAIEPERVDVRTHTTDEAWIVRLYGDHSFELVTDARRPGTGSSVTLLHTMTAEHFALHAELTQKALRKWCRHAHVPITFSAVDGYDAGQALDVNVPLTLPGVATFSAAENGETYVVAVGHPQFSADARALENATLFEQEPTFGGFYNRGLRLMETTEAEPGLEGVRFKVDSPHLSHTLSRDSIRRDDQSRRVLERVHELVRSALWSELVRCIAREAEDAVAGSHERYAFAVEAALAPAFEAALESLAVPLAEPIEGASTMTVRELSRASRRVVLVADGSTPLTIALARKGTPVMRHVALAPLMRRVLKMSVIGAERMFSFVAAREETEEDAALARELARLSCAAGRSVAQVRLAHFHGAAGDVPCRVLGTSEPTALTPEDVALRHVWGSSSTLFLNAEHTTVRLARRRAKSDAGVAAQLLVRAILVADGPLEAKVVDRLLACAGTAGERDV